MSTGALLKKPAVLMVIGAVFSMVAAIAAALVLSHQLLLTRMVPVAVLPNTCRFLLLLA